MVISCHSSTNAHRFLLLQQLIATGIAFKGESVLAYELCASLYIKLFTNRVVV